MPDPVVRSAALAKFLDVVCSRHTAEIVDLGPVIGSNVAFLGERVRCKIHVEDLLADLDHHVRQDTLDSLPDFLATRFPLSAASVDGVLSWDVFDYLDSKAAAVLGRELTRMLRPGGVLLAFFSTVVRSDPGHTKYVIEDGDHVRCRVYPGVAGRRPGVLENRDVIRLFEGLEVSASVLLKSHVREMVFRKPAGSAVTPIPAVTPISAAPGARRTEARR